MPRLPFRPSPTNRVLRRPFPLVLLLTLLLGSLCAQAATVSKKYKLEKNKAVGLDLASGEVRAENVTFEFPSSVLRFETANKARVSVVNSSKSNVRVGLAIALFDADGNLVGAGVGGNKGGRLGAGETEEFSVFFYYVNEKLPDAITFQITMEIR